MTTAKRKPYHPVPPHVVHLWEQYTHHRTIRLRNALVEHYLPLSRRIADLVLGHLPSHVDHDDIRSDAMLGLINAVERFEPERGLRFETYCSTRVRGAILDGIRDRDWVPRLTRRRTKLLLEALDALRDELCREPIDEEVRRKLRMDRRQFDMVRADQAVVTHSLYHTFTNSEGREKGIGHAAPGDDLARVQDRDAVERVLSDLDDSERTVVELYHLKEMTMHDIGQRLGVTESAVSQRHKRAMSRLRYFNRYKPAREQESAVA